MENGFDYSPYVLAHIGRQYRKMATTKEEILTAVGYLNHCICKTPKRHIVWHQLGLAYKALWIIDNNFAEKAAYLKGRAILRSNLDNVSVQICIPRHTAHDTEYNFRPQYGIKKTSLIPPLPLQH